MLFSDLFNFNDNHEDWAFRFNNVHFGNVFQERKWVGFWSLGGKGILKQERCITINPPENFLSWYLGA